MPRKKSVLYPVLFMILITAIYTFVLAGINALSSDLIATQEALRIEKSIFYVNHLETDLDDKAIHQLFQSSFETVTTDKMTYYIYRENGDILSYALPFSGRGLWGTIKGYIALSSDFNTVIGIDFISHSETPGLGGRIEEEWYKSQFNSLALDSSPYIVYQGNETKQLDAITGATLTSNAVKEILNNFIANLKDNPEEVMGHE